MLCRILPFEMLVFVKFNEPFHYPAEGPRHLPESNGKAEGLMVRACVVRCVCTGLVLCWDG